MASPLFCQCLRHNFGLELFFDVHLLEPTILLFKLFDWGHQRRAHATQLGSPLVQSCRADTQLTTYIWNAKT
jgi:hypothetical protein